ncbi:MAG TPA: type IV secretory system conjugative DNA transfer family protein [Candidatus Paceibacterota bacterium]
MKDNDPITYFAETDYRNRRTPFGIKSSDRTRHVYVIGKTGMGKSTALENMAIQDIQNGNGLAFVDPHGKTAELLLDYVPENRIKDVLYFAPFDMDYPVAFNIMEDVGPDKRHLVVNGLMSTFEKIWVDAWSARMAYILSNTLLALLEFPGSTLLGINRMLSDKEYRKLVIANVKDPSVRSFWVDEFSKYTDRYAQEATPAIQNKVGQFTSNPLIRNIIGQPNSTFDLRKMMDEKKIIIVNLSKGRVGEGNANLLGSMIITKLYLAAMSRADVSEIELKKLPNFYLYVDEFQSFANKSFADILSEARKYKLNLTIAHQYIEQMEEEVRSAVFGNVGTMITFRVGAYDAEVLEKEFAPIFTAEDLVNLGSFQVYLKLMIDGVSSSPFSARTLPPIEKSVMNWKDDVIASSRKIFARTRESVEGEIKSWHEPVKLPEVKKDDKKLQMPATLQPPVQFSPSKTQSSTRVSPPTVPMPPKPAKQEVLQKNPSDRLIKAGEFAKAFEMAGVSPAKIEAKPKIEPNKDFKQKESIRQPVQAPFMDSARQPRKGDENRAENMSALKAALSQVLKDGQKKEEVKPQPVKNFEPIKRQENHNKISESHRGGKPNQPKQNEPPRKAESNPNEVSPEVLKAILHDGDDKKI